MQDSASTAIVVGVYLSLMGIGWGVLVDPIRPLTYWISAVSVCLTGFLIAGLASDAAPTIPLLVVFFALTASLRERSWRASLIREERPTRTPPPPPPSASATE